MMSGHMPMLKKCRISGTCQWNRPKPVRMVSGSGAREILDPAEERLMAHLDGGVEHLVEREEHRDLHHDRQAAGRRVDLLAAIELHQLLVHALAGPRRSAP